MVSRASVVSTAWVLIACVSVMPAQAGGDGTPQARSRLDSEGFRPVSPHACMTTPDPGDDGRIGYVRDYLQAHHATPMAGIAVVSDGALIATMGTGGADSQTMFWIASTSKFVTAVGAVALMEQGRRYLDSSGN